MVMAPVNTTSISAYIQLKRSGKLNMEDHPKCRSNLLFALTRVTPLENFPVTCCRHGPRFIKELFSCANSNLMHLYSQIIKLKNILKKKTTLTVMWPQTQSLYPVEYTPTFGALGRNFHPSMKFSILIYLVYCSYQWLCWHIWIHSPWQITCSICLSLFCSCSASLGPWEETLPSPEAPPVCCHWPQTPQWPPLPEKRDVLVHSVW